VCDGGGGLVVSCLLCDVAFGARCVGRVVIMVSFRMAVVFGRVVVVVVVVVKRGGGGGGGGESRGRWRRYVTV
jgi:hypothetical protein